MKNKIIFYTILILLTSNILRAQHDTASVTYLGRNKDNRVEFDSANYGYRIIRQYDHPRPFLNWFSFKSYTKNWKPAKVSNWEKPRTKMLISFKSGFDDSAEVYLNDSLIFKKYLRTQFSISSTMRSVVVQPQLNGTKKDIVKIHLLKNDLYLQFALNDKFDYVRIDCDKQNNYKSWWVSHGYYKDKNVVNSDGYPPVERLKKLEKELYGEHY